MALKRNTLAPDFSLPSTNGRTFGLRQDFGGRPCIVYFYPKDFTGACTQEACSFRDAFSEFQGLNIDIVGISRDDIPTHKRFKAEHSLPFELLSDASGEVCKTYDALVPILGIPKRITYLLDKDHRIAAVFDNFFDGKAHMKAMVEELKKGKL